jgi:septal ring factor EnvC (AmiA/AmiB activator)
MKINTLDQSRVITDPSSTSDLMNQKENIKIKLKELRQLEQKLRKKEEQLKLKEAMINDDSKEKGKILDRLYKAEHKNLEFEQTIKTLNRRIATMESQHSIHTSQGSNCNTQRAIQMS